MNNIIKTMLLFGILGVTISNCVITKDNNAAIEQNTVSVNDFPKLFGKQNCKIAEIKKRCNELQIRNMKISANNINICNELDELSLKLEQANMDVWYLRRERAQLAKAIEVLQKQNRELRENEDL